MKKFILLFLLLFLPLKALCTDWYDIGNNIYIDTDLLKTKGHYLYLKLKFDDISSLNTLLKKYSPGVLLDKSNVGYITFDTIVDCKEPRYKVPLTMIYDKQNNLINKIKNNTWDNDLTRADWGGYCDLYDILKKDKMLNTKDETAKNELAF